jgi:hypothetical protein
MVSGSNEDLAATASDANHERRLAHGRAVPPRDSGDDRGVA